MLLEFFLMILSYLFLIIFFSGYVTGSSSHHGLSTGVIIALVVCAVVATALVVAIAALGIKRYRANKRSNIDPQRLLSEEM